MTENNPSPSFRDKLLDIITFYQFSMFGKNKAYRLNDYQIKQIVAAHEAELDYYKMKLYHYESADRLLKGVGKPK